MITKIFVFKMNKLTAFRLDNRPSGGFLLLNTEDEGYMKYFKKIFLLISCILPLCFAGCKPVVTITAPANGDTFAVGETITFEGQATDPLHPNLDDTAFVWTSDKDGGIGTGASLTTVSLSAGEHTITLTVTDPDGQVGQSSVKITIGNGGVSTTTTATTSIAATTTSTVTGINLDAPLPQPQSSQEALAFDINTFGMQEYKLLSQDNALVNFSFSPYSISNCLAMIYTGAKNSTALQMADVLDYTLPQEELPQVFGGLAAEMVLKNNADNATDYNLMLKIANSGWLQKDYVFLPSYTEILQSGFNASVSPTDFKKDPEGARQTINQWASDNTAGKIPELIPKPAINDAIRLVVVNTVYFKGSWSLPFIESSTQDNPFYLIDGTSKTVPVMNNTGTYKYARGDYFQAVALAYHQPSTLGMVIVLPDLGKFAQVEEKITAGGLYAILHNMQPNSVKLGMPKFKTKTHRSMKADLEALGMTDVFHFGVADLSGIDGNGNLPEKLYLVFVEHEAVIDVNEKGTEAAAATAAGGGGGGGPGPEPIEFTADRPFIFAIYDRATETVLFLGRILDPSQQAQ